jgi:hypothetical protein
MEKQEVDIYLYSILFLVNSTKYMVSKNKSKESQPAEKFI